MHALAGAARSAGCDSVRADETCQVLLGQQTRLPAFATTGFVLYLFKFYYFLHEKHGWGDPPPGKAGALEMTGLGPDEAVVLEAL